MTSLPCRAPQAPRGAGPPTGDVQASGPAPRASYQLAPVSVLPTAKPAAKRRLRATGDAGAEWRLPTDAALSPRPPWGAHRDDASRDKPLARRTDLKEDEIDCRKPFSE
mmetsp:Transcript_9101/g.22040  ORF Transcript_9101/g.22040 Transcript_9101/m.22040 type:complete len:109 (+) Transcript_9101:226-552(+)